MRILFINGFFYPEQPGGAERSVKRLVDLHVAADDDVSVITTHGGDGTIKETIDGATVYRIAARNIYWHKQPEKPTAWKRLIWHSIDSFNPLIERELKRLLGCIQPDIISSHNLAGISVALWAAAKANNIPVVQVLRDYYNICPNVAANSKGHNCAKQCGSCAMFRLPHRGLSQTVSAVIGCSHAVLAKHLREGYFDGVPIRDVIHNAEAVPPIQLQQAAPSGQAPFTFGYIGSLSPTKGLPGLLTAFIQANQLSKRPVRLIVAGSGQQSFVAQLQSQFNHKDIHFLGHIESRDFYPQCDACIVPSIWDDPLPGVVIQALAHNLPVIGADRGGIPEMVKNSENGVIYDPDKPDALVAAMTTLANDSILYSRFKANARPSVAHFLNVDRMLHAYQSVYQQVLASHHQQSMRSDKKAGPGEA